MPDSISNLPTRRSHTVRKRSDVSKLTAQISQLDAAEHHTRDIIHRISSLLHDILESQSQSRNMSEKQKLDVGEKLIELTASITILNSIREQLRYGYPVLHTLWKQLGDVRGEDENVDIEGQVRRLNRLHEQNRQEILALWREVRDLHREGVKLAGEKGLVGSKAGKGGTGGTAWGDVLRVFSGMEPDL